MKCKRFFTLIICVFVFTIIQFGYTNGGNAPQLEFISWKVGQGEPNSKHFVTDSETVCTVSACVGYTDEQPANAYTLNSISWEVTMTHGFTFSIVQWQYGATGMTSTDFCIHGTANGEPHKTQAHPNNGRPDTDEKGVLQHNAPMKVTIKFTGYYGTDPSDQKEVTVIKELIQDEIDQMRQEYVDHAIAIPSRDSFTNDADLFATYVTPSQDEDYGYLVYDNLAGHHADWAEECEKILRKKKPNATVTVDDLDVQSGYRSPEHNRHHISPPGGKGSYHQYGLAIDVTTIDLNGDDKVTKSIDGPLMYKAAKDADAGYANYVDYKTITHADWGPER